MADGALQLSDHLQVYSLYSLYKVVGEAFSASFCVMSFYQHSLLLCRNGDMKKQWVGPHEFFGMDIKVEGRSSYSYTHSELRMRHKCLRITSLLSHLVLSHYRFGMEIGSVRGCPVTTGRESAPADT